MILGERKGSRRMRSFNYSKLKDYQWDSEVLGLVAQIHEFKGRINLVDDKLPAIEQVRAAVKEKIGKFTKGEIMELVSSIGKASVENSLKKLTEEGVIKKRGQKKATFYTRND